MTPRQLSPHRGRHALTLSAAALLAAATTAAGMIDTAASASTIGPTAAMTVTSPWCGITWGSLEKILPGTFGPGTPTGTPSVTGVRSGRHTCYDRLVVDVRGHSPGVSVGYVNVVRSEGSGEPVSLAGGALISVVVHAPSTDTDTGAPTYVPADASDLTAVAGDETFRQVAWAGSYEGTTSIGLGVRARLPFRVFTLAGPGDGSRVVIDVAHHW